MITHAKYIVHDFIQGKCSSRALARQCWSIATTARRVFFTFYINKKHIKGGACLFIFSNMHKLVCLTKTA